jgi:hypothetical protein
MPTNPQVREAFSAMEGYYLGDGWYSDGPDRPRDYYISMGFHFYGLIYAKLMADIDPHAVLNCVIGRCCFPQTLSIFCRRRGGRAVWSQPDLSLCSGGFLERGGFCRAGGVLPGVIKGIVLRHLRWWLKQPLFDRDGVLSVGYSYPNLIMAEDYNAPGSPYWALKTMLVLAMGEDDPFLAGAGAAAAADRRAAQHKHADQVLVHQTDHLWMLTSGQLELNNFVNTEAKYCKFAYSTRYGFTIERGRYGLSHAAPDSCCCCVRKMITGAGGATVTR